MPELDWLDVTIRLGVAALLTGAIGAERELRERAAGLRTHMLVGVGSALFTLVSAYAWGDFFVAGAAAQQRLDPTRIAAQIVSGIGFLGAGAILRQGLSVRGLTTAAGLWVSAAIGMAAAAAFWPAAIVTTAIVMLGLGPFRAVERWLNRLGGEAGVLEVHLVEHGSIGAVVDVLEPLRVNVYSIEFDAAAERRSARMELELPDGVAPASIIADVTALEDVEGARWSG
jgi:putative Mg2+ transporter-C (MgtC) family protein